MHVLFIATGLLAGLATAVPSHYGGSAPDTQSVIAARQMPPCPVGMICLPLYHGIPHPKEPEVSWLDTPEGRRKLIDHLK